MKPRKFNRNLTNFQLDLSEYLKAVKWGNEYDFLKYYQNITREYFNNVDVDSRGLLIYYTMGMGKSLLAVSIAMEQIASGRNIMILLTKSLQENMRATVRKYIEMRRATEPNYGPTSDLEKWIDGHFRFVSMNASNMHTQVARAATRADGLEEVDLMLERKFAMISSEASLNGYLLIVDEAHNLFRSIINGSTNALRLYELIMRSKDLRILFLTGTPISNNPYELAIAFNCLGSRKPNNPVFPENYKEFADLYMDEEAGSIKNKWAFQNRIMGLVSYVSIDSRPGSAANRENALPEVNFPKEHPMIIEKVEMSHEQYVVYQLAREKEKTETGSESKGRATGIAIPKSVFTSSYRVRSRQYCNNTSNVDESKTTKITSKKFERMLHNIEKHQGRLGLVYSQFVNMGGLGAFSIFLEQNGWQRAFGPRKIGDNSYIENIELEAKKQPIEGAWYIGGSAKKIKNTSSTKIEIRNVQSSDLPMDEVTIEDLRSPYSVIMVKVGKKIDALGFLETQPAPNNKSGSKTIMYKYWGNNKWLDAIWEHIGVEKPFSEHEIDILDFPSGKGIDLSIFGANNETSKYYAVIQGEIPIEDRNAILETFTSPDNMHGKHIALLLISTTGIEGLDLRNVCHIHIMEPHWVYIRIHQIISRGVRNGSHLDLPENEREVQPYIYISVPPPEIKSREETSDEELYRRAEINYRINESFVASLREVHIECVLNRDANCRICNPTGVPMFGESNRQDLLHTDPCQPIVERSIETKALEFQGQTYNYVLNNKALYKYDIYEHLPDLNRFRKIRESDPRIEQIVEAIVGESAKTNI